MSDFLEKNRLYAPKTVLCAEICGTLVVYAEGSNSKVGGSISGRFFWHLFCRFFDAFFE